MTAPALYRPDIGPAPTVARLPVSPADWSRGVLLRAPNHLGDCLMALPAAWQLKQLLPPGSRLSVLCRERVEAVWRAAAWVDDVVTFRDRRIEADERAAVAALAPDAALVMPNSFGSALDLRRAGLDCIIGRRGRGRALLLHHSLPAWTRRPGEDQHHEARHYLELIASLGEITWTADYPALTPQLSDAEREAAERDLPTGEPRLILAPGAAYGPAKQWPTAQFREVATAWSSTRGPVIAIGAPGEEAAAAEVVDGLPRSFNRAGKTSLGQLIYLLSTATAVVVNDSGAMHLAGAVGASGVAVFGSTDPVATGPIGGQIAVLHRPPACSPCLLRTCPRTDAPYECLTSIPAADAIAALDSLTATPASR